MAPRPDGFTGWLYSLVDTTSNGVINTVTAMPPNILAANVVSTLFGLKICKINVQWKSYIDRMDKMVRIDGCSYRLMNKS